MEDNPKELWFDQDNQGFGTQKITVHEHKDYFLISIWNYSVNKLVMEKKIPKNREKIQWTTTNTCATLTKRSQPGMCELFLGV